MTEVERLRRTIRSLEYGHRRAGLKISRLERHANLATRLAKRLYATEERNRQLEEQVKDLRARLAGKPEAPEAPARDPLLDVYQRVTEADDGNAHSG